MQIAEGARKLLQLLPGRDSGADLRLERLRDVEGLRPPVRPAEAQREMRPVLGTVRTVASRPAAAPVGLGQGAKHDAGDELLEAAEEGSPRRARTSCH
jgi:hypothetical protein